MKKTSNNNETTAFGNTMLADSKNAVLTGVKLSCIRKDGAITTWHDIGRPVEEIINEVKKNKNWVGGKFEWVRLEYDVNGKYVEKFIEHEKYDYLLKA